MSLNQSFEELQLMEQSFELVRSGSSSQESKPEFNQDQGICTLASAPTAHPTDPCLHQAYLLPSTPLRKAPQVSEVAPCEKEMGAHEDHLGPDEDQMLLTAAIGPQSFGISDDQKVNEEDRQVVQLECEVSYVYGCDSKQVKSEGVVSSQPSQQNQDHKVLGDKAAKLEKLAPKSNESSPRSKELTSVSFQLMPQKTLKRQATGSLFHGIDKRTKGARCQPGSIQVDHTHPHFEDIKQGEAAQSQAKKQQQFTIACQRLNKTKSKPKPTSHQQPASSSPEPSQVLVPIKQDPMFQSFFSECKFPSEGVRCSSGGKAAMVCVEKKCAGQAYLCSDQQCSSCLQTHQHCSLKFTLPMIEEIMNRNLLRQKDLVRAVFQVQENVIQTITQQRKRMQQFLCLQGASNEVLAKIREQSSAAEYPILRSGDILGMMEEFAQQEANQQYRIACLKDRVLKDEESLKKILQSETELMMEPFDYYKMTGFPSNLVTSKPEVRFILQSLNFPKQIRLAYRASQHQFNLKKYHQLCDNLPNTLTVLKTEHDKLVGAFTPLKLNNKQGRDRSNRTFLMAINIREKLEHIRAGECAVYYDPELGPCFGGLFEQKDIEVFKENGLLYCTTSFPNTFNWKRQFVHCQESRRFLTGVEEGKRCQVMDFEVFEVLPRS